MTNLGVGQASADRFGHDVAMLADVAAEEPIGVAVSGGSDSLALLLLANVAFPDRVRAISIDHGLRADAANECRFVERTCAALGIPRDTVAVVVRPDGKGVQAAAREARLQAYTVWCHLHRIRWIMTGHHADDQAETLLMRLARGSGVAGLRAIAPRDWLWRMPLDAIRADPSLRPQILRPLLSWTRVELARIVSDAGLEAVVDPSNHDQRFDRTRFRALLAQTDLLDARRLSATASHCRDAEEALAFTALQVKAAVTQRHDEHGIELDATQLLRWPREIIRRVVDDMFTLVAGFPEPRGAQLMRLIDLLHAGRPATLAGIKATPHDGRWTFAPAPPRRSY